jgi:ABC-2 type transport system permease protein
VASLQARASCQKGTRSTAQSGAGDDWVCQITFVVAASAAPTASTAPAPPVTAVYNVDVETDGCYAADGVGPVSINGTRTITGLGNQQRLNPLWLIDGCFDVG